MMFSRVVSIALVAGLAPVAGAQVIDVLDPAGHASSNPGAVQRFRPAVDTAEGPFTCRGPENYSENALIYYAYFPSADDYKATVTVFADTLGNLTRFAERRGPPIRTGPTTGMTPQQIGAAVSAAAKAVRTTLISADLATGRIVVGNRGGGEPDENVLVSLDDLTGMQKFGYPVARAERVLNQCRQDASKP